MKSESCTSIFVLAALLSASFCCAEPATPLPTLPVTQAIEAANPAIIPADSVASETSILKLPRVIDFGSKQCPACKSMEPILESLAKNHADQFSTEFVDVREAENQAFAKSHGIKTIPTQIFLNAQGLEVFRNVGFFTEEQVLAKWTELGLLSVASTTTNLDAGAITNPSSEEASKTSNAE